MHAPRSFQSLSVLSFASLSALAAAGLAGAGATGCSAAAGGGGSPSGSEVAVSMVSGAINNNSGSSVAANLFTPKHSAAEKVLAFMNPIGTAYGADWSCSGSSISPTFTGAAGNPYLFNPPSCKVSWEDGRSAESTWSGPFTLNFGGSCDTVHSAIDSQGAGCDVLRTTAGDGDTRTITGPDGNNYAIDHDTNGAGTGWDSSITPAPTDTGVEVTCGSDGCAASRTVVINGSHLTGTVNVDALSKRIWDHTVTSSGLTVTGTGSSRVVSGTVTVQHNLIHAVSTTTFVNVSYGDEKCCFPTEGSVTTVYQKGEIGKTEKITFGGGACGETTLTDNAGASATLTLAHCL